MVGTLLNIFQYIHFTPLFKNKIHIYFSAITILIIITYMITILLFTMAFRIKNNKLNILWPIKILKFCLPFFSFTFFGQSFLLLSTIFDCKDGYSYVSTTLKCRTGVWFSTYGPMAGIALFLQSGNAIITNSLYFKHIFFINDSDLLKKTNSLPDTTFIITKIAINILFISDEGKESEHWKILFILILLTGINAYCSLYYQNKSNKVLTALNNIFSLITVLAYISLLIGKIFKTLEFTGSIYLFFSIILIIIIFIFIYKNNEIDHILINYTDINNPVDFLYYISKIFNIIQNRNKSRNYLIILKTLLFNIEENCIIKDCPLNKYLDNLKNGIDCPFLLNQYCQKLFEYGITKFSNDISLKNNYSIFLLTTMNYKKKALMILNSIKNKTFSFQNKFEVYRISKLINKMHFSKFHKNNSTFRYRKNLQEFKLIIKKIILLYYDFMSLLLNSKQENIDNFNKIHEIGLQIMKFNPKLEEIYSNLINIKTDNLEVIKLYSEFIEKILKNEEKIEKYQKIAKLSFSNNFDIHEKDYSNFDLDILKDKGNIPYLIICMNNEYLTQIIDISVKAIKLFGYMKNEIIGKNLNILLPKIFQEKHSILLLEEYEKQKLKLFDDLNKKKEYFPQFIKKETYGVSKMKFLIELKLIVYFVKTEENRLLYIVEIINYFPHMLDLIKNFNNSSKCCILTDENFVIQTFTPNCIESLKLNYSDINSNYSIINYIKQFQESYITAINSSSIGIFSHMSGEMHSDEKLSKNNIPPIIKRKLKEELLSKKFSKRSKITWRTKNEEYLSKNYGTKKSQNSIKYTKSNIFRINKSDNTDYEIEAFMEINKIKIEDEVLGYYFYFTKIKSRNYCNMSYVIQKNETIGIKNDKTQLKLKVYQCKFRKHGLNNIEESKYISGKNLLFSSLIEKKTSEKGNLRKNKKRKSVGKNSFVSFSDKNNYDNLLEQNSLITIQNKKKNFRAYKIDTETDSLMITGDFIPEFSSHFYYNIKDSSFIKIKAKDNMNFIEKLKIEANNKINNYKRMLKLLSYESKSSSLESEEFESENISSDKLNSNSYLFKDSSHSNSLDENKENKNEAKDSVKGSEKKLFPILKNCLKRDKNNVGEINNSTKSIQKREKKGESFYKVNFDKIIFMRYDIRKDLIVEDEYYPKISQVENVMIDFKNQDSNNIDMEKDERFSYFSPLNKKSKENNDNNKKNTKKGKNDNKNIKNAIVKIKKKKIINDEKITEKKIYESLNKNKNEKPIIRLKFLVFISFIFMVLFAALTLVFDLTYINEINYNLDIIKCTMLIKYYSYTCVYYLRELTLLNFEISEIEGGFYENIVAKNKDEYKALIKEKLSQLFIDNQSSMKTLYSFSFSLSKNIAKNLSNTLLDIKMSSQKKIDMKYDILTALMQYSSAFYHLAYSPTEIEQNHSDLYTFIYNNLNGYKRGIDILINNFRNELNMKNKEIILLFIIVSFLIFIFFITFYVLVVINFLSALQTRGNYMKVFYGINENILKQLIFSCEDLLSKLKSFEEQDESFYDIENKLTFEKNKNEKYMENSLIENSNLNDNENRAQKKLSFTEIAFVVTYLLFTLIFYSYFIFNGIKMLNKSNDSIIRTNLCFRMINNELVTIDTFNIYREFLFDDQSIIEGLSPYEYLLKGESEGFQIMSDNIEFIYLKGKKLLNKVNEILKRKTLCSYYINDYFDSSTECEEKIGLITKYDFNILEINFLEEINIRKKVVKYKLENENVLGNLTEYNYSDYINNDKIIKKGENTDYTNIFRLELFNNYTIHYELNIIFFSIILPFIEENRNALFNMLISDKSKSYFISLNIIFLLLISLIFFCYFWPIIKFVNNIIYKTKNMLSIIPLRILSFQSDALILLNISNEK